MNERIQQLIKQSKPDNWIDLQTRYGELPMLSGDQVEKFAELIVRECTNLTLDHKSDDYYNGWLDYRDEIKRHFGVEE